MNDYGFLKVAACSPKTTVADLKQNSIEIIKNIEHACEIGINLIVFPELCITSYTCGDLFAQDLLIKKSKDYLFKIVQATKELDIISIVGLPVEYAGKLYNCGAVFTKGEILGFAVKSNIPNYNEFYELRNFSQAPDENSFIVFDNNVKQYPFGKSLIFQCKENPYFKFGVEICEDLWVPNSPSDTLCQNGAIIIANLSCSDETVAKNDYRNNLVLNKSSICICGYIYADANCGESTTDMVFSANNFIAENGIILSKSEPFELSNFQYPLIVSEIDIEKLYLERKKINTFKQSLNCQMVDFSYNFNKQNSTLERKIEKHPFIPNNLNLRNQRCNHILQIQSFGLKKRIEHSKAEKIVVGISGGLDSCLALLVCVRAIDLLKRDRKDILAITMPCFGTTARTKSNAQILSEELGTTFLTIDIKKSVDHHFKDINHNKENLNVVFENSQARERTQVLMDIANKENGIVIGTGDLSELALGWATYNGDHMSMYGVNSSIPKTLIRHIVKY
ncbi:MAG: NAD(+) synthase [Clostridia bacterium]